MAANPGSISSRPAAAALTGAELLPLDQEIGAPVAATALVVGNGYRIVSLGNTNWTAAGAGATPAVGTVFGCTAVGTGTGTAQRVETRRATAQEIAAYAQRREFRSAVGAWAAGLRFIYLGSAAPGTAEASTGWVVTRLTRNTAGAIVATATGSGAWNNYASLTYS